MSVPMNQYIFMSYLLLQIIMVSFFVTPALAQDSSNKLSSRRSSPTHSQSLPHRSTTVRGAQSAIKRVEGKYVTAFGMSFFTLYLRSDRHYYISLISDASDPSDPHGDRGKSYGTWSLGKEAAVILTPRDSKRKFRYLSHVAIYYFVPWGARTYLIGEAEFPAFKKAIAFHQEPRDRDVNTPPFLLRSGDEKKAVSGVPSFPLRWSDTGKLPESKSIAPL